MPFHEKSAWVMVLGLLVTSFLYFSKVISMSYGGSIVPPNLPALLVYTVILVVIAVVGHILIASFSTKEANARLDERERQIFTKAGYFSGNVFGFGVVFSLAVYLFSHSGHLLFYMAFASLVLSQVLEYVLQIYFYRRFIC